MTPNQSKPSLFRLCFMKTKNKVNSQLIINLPKRDPFYEPTQEDIEKIAELFSILMEADQSLKKQSREKTGD